jgi:hypothetical protein
VILPLALLLFAVTAAHAETPTDYATGARLAGGSGRPFHRLAVPDAVYEGTVGRGLADVRVFNADGAIVPYAWLPRPEPARGRAAAIDLPLFPLLVERGRRDVAGLALSVERTPGGTAIRVTTADGQPVAGQVLGGYVLDATALTEPLTALVFALPQAPGAATMRVRVDASDDLAAWRSIAPAGVLVNLEYAGRRLTRDRVEFAPTRAKYLRVTWAVEGPVIEFSGVAGESGEHRVDAPRQWREVKGAPVADRAGEYEFDLGGAFPIDRLAMVLPEVNSVVPVEILARATPKDPWQPIATAVFYRLQQTGGEVASEPAVVAGADRRHWLLRVDPRSGGLAGTVPQLHVGWPPQELVYAARGPAPFTLAWGRHGAPAGALPIPTLVPGYDNTKPFPAPVDVVSAGAPIRLGGPDRLRPPPDSRRWLLWASLVLAAALLGWMAWRLSRELDRGDEGAPPDAPRE